MPLDETDLAGFVSRLGSSGAVFRILAWGDSLAACCPLLAMCCQVSRQLLMSVLLMSVLLMSVLLMSVCVDGLAGCILCA